MTGKSLVPSSFHNQFSKELARMFRAVLRELMTTLAASEVRYGGVLEGFRDVLVADATVVKLRFRHRSIVAPSMLAQQGLSECGYSSAIARATAAPNRSWSNWGRSAGSHGPAEESPERPPDPMGGVATSALARRVSRLNTVLTWCSRPAPITDSSIPRKLSAMFAGVGGFAPQEPAQQSGVWWRTGRAAGNGVR